MSGLEISFNDEEMEKVESYGGYFTLDSESGAIHQVQDPFLYSLNKQFSINWSQIASKLSRFVEEDPEEPTANEVIFENLKGQSVHGKVSDYLGEDIVKISHKDIQDSIQSKFDILSQVVRPTQTLLKFAETMELVIADIQDQGVDRSVLAPIIKLQVSLSSVLSKLSSASNALEELNVLWGDVIQGN